MGEGELEARVADFVWRRLDTTISRIRALTQASASLGPSVEAGSLGGRFLDREITTAPIAISAAATMAPDMIRRSSPASASWSPGGKPAISLSGPRSRWPGPAFLQERR
jgi:hypothetical protein